MTEQIAKKIKRLSRCQQRAPNIVDDAKSIDEADIPGKAKRLGYLPRLADQNDSEEFLNRFLQIEDEMSS